MKKIAQVVCVFPPYKGGMGNVACEYQKQLIIFGHIVSVFTPKYNKVSGIGQNAEVVRMYPLIKLGNAAFVPQLFFLLRESDIVILHYPFFGAEEIMAFFKLFYKKKKLIIHYHMDAIGLSFFAKILTLPAVLLKQRLFKSADAVTCASLDYVKNSSIAKIYEKMPEKFREIPFGVDHFLFHPKKNTEFFISATKRILFVGGLDRAHYFKGLDVLLIAVSKISKKYDFFLDIVGDGSLKADYQKRADELGLSGTIKFHGAINKTELAEIYRHAYVLVLPSITNGEAFGLVLLESMASGVPVIASNLPGVRGVFQDKEQGFLVEPNDQAGLQDRLEMMLGDLNLRNAMAGKALAKSREYSWEKAGEALNSVIAKLS